MAGETGRTCLSATNNSLTTATVPDPRPSLSPENVEPRWLPLSSASFHGPKTLMNFETITGGPNPAETPTPFLLQQPETKVENIKEDYINGGLFLQPAGKKRRLSQNQVRFLETTFEEENKLEPERKAQLAKELGLQPRQVAIWFQNRRARYKTKQLEKEYEALKASHDNLKVDCDNLAMENEKLKQEVLSLKEKMHTREKEDHISDPTEVIKLSNVNSQKPVVKEVAEIVSNVPTLECKLETASSTKSDILDSESTWIEPASSSHVFEPDHSDFSQEEADDLSKKYLPLQFLPRLEDDETANSCKFGLLHEGRHFWEWGLD